MGITYVNAYCNKTLDYTKLGPKFTAYLDDVKEFEKNLAGVSAQYLCTEQCPCPQQNSTNGWYSKFISAKINEKNFTTFMNKAADSRFKRNFTITTNLAEYRKAVSDSKNTPLYVSTTAKTYDNFYDCYMAVNDYESKQIIANPSYQRRV